MSPAQRCLSSGQPRPVGASRPPRPLARSPACPRRLRTPSHSAWSSQCGCPTHGLHTSLKRSVMDKRAASGRGEPIPSILKKPKGRLKGDLLDKSTKIKREKVEGSKKGGDASAPLPQGCTPLMYACQQADYKAVVDNLNKDVSSSSYSDIRIFLCLKRRMACSLFPR